MSPISSTQNSEIYLIVPILLFCLSTTGYAGREDPLELCSTEYKSRCPQSTDLRVALKTFVSLADRTPARCVGSVGSNPT